MTKPRILIPITIQFAVRYMLRTHLLEKLSEYSLPIILTAWEDEALRLEFEQVGAEVRSLPIARYGKDHSRLKAQLDLSFKDKLNSPSTAIDGYRSRIGKSFSNRLRTDVRDTYYRMRRLLPDTPYRLIRDENRAIWSDTNISEFHDLLTETKPDFLFSLTPFLPSEQLLLRAAFKMKIPMVSAILSFDNITTRGWIPVVFDHYLLWNHYNVAELRRAYPEASDKPLTIVGAPQFDFYWDKNYLWDEANWRDTLRLPAERPVILFGAGHKSITPHEIQYIAHIDEAIESGMIKHNPLILFRQHPNDSIERWQPILEKTKHVIYDKPWITGQLPALTNITRCDIEKLVSTLFHSAIHINVSSTMTIDGAIFDRPQIGPAYNELANENLTRVAVELYEREHFQPITASGGLDVAMSRDALISSINTYLDAPQQDSDSRHKMVEDIISYTDGQATHRVNQAIKHFLNVND